MDADSCDVPAGTDVAVKEAETKQVTRWGWKESIATFLFVPLVLYLVVSLLGWFRKPRVVPFQHAPSTYLQIWRSQKLVSIQSPAQLQKLIQQIRFYDHVGLTQEQKTELLHSAYNLIAAYVFQDLDRFLAFRLPVSRGEFLPSVLEYFRGYFAKRKEATNDLSDPVVFYRLLWHDPRYGMGTVRWRQIAVEGSGFCVQQSPELPDLSTNLFALRIYSPPADTVAVSGLGSRFLFLPRPEDIVKKQKKILHALLWLIVREEGDPQPFPILCQWYWSPKDKKWLPCFLGDGDVRKKSHGLVF